VIGHASPEAAAGGAIGLIEDGDEILIDVHGRTLKVLVDDDTLAERRAKMEAAENPWQPKDRQRSVSKALRAYAKLASSADRGAVRQVD
jgi:dihydroxy-acid dehydratase